jgi:pimeloyl-ACP methyl ester carboxylesterase
MTSTASTPNTARVIPKTQTLGLVDVDLVYDVRGPIPAADAKPLLLMIEQPMTAEGFATLASYFPDRTVVTYDPRGLGRSQRRDGRDDLNPIDQTADLHALVAALGAGPVDVFASSGGAVTALAWVASHGSDIVTLVIHEPPVFSALPDADAAYRARAAGLALYNAKGGGAAMAGFIGMISWSGPFTDAYFAQCAPDPAAFGMPADDDGKRDDPLLSRRSEAVTDYQPDYDAIKAASARVVIAAGILSGDTVCARASRAVAARLGQEATVFPSHHGGFAGEPEASPPSCARCSRAELTFFAGLSEPDFAIRPWIRLTETKGQPSRAQFSRSGNNTMERTPRWPRTGSACGLTKTPKLRRVFTRQRFPIARSLPFSRPPVTIRPARRVTY